MNSSVAPPSETTSTTRGTLPDHHRGPAAKSCLDGKKVMLLIEFSVGCGCGGASSQSGCRTAVLVVLLYDPHRRQLARRQVAVPGIASPTVGSCGGSAVAARPQRCHELSTRMERTPPPSSIEPAAVRQRKMSPPQENLAALHALVKAAVA